MENLRIIKVIVARQGKWNEKGIVMKREKSAPRE